MGYIDPNNGEIQCRALGVGNNYTVPRATASLAKLITVQVVLEHKPLKNGEAGPTITISADDEASYWYHVWNGGSYARVINGEQISERQLIEGILLASANNMADTLAKWAFGSLDNYRAAAQQWLNNHGLTSTTVGVDASGLDPSTTSTPTDLCKIMLLATRQPSLVEIMGMPETTLPTGDILTTTNRVLGQHGVFAGKTGYNDEAGRGMVVAAQQEVNGVKLTTAAVSLSNDSYQAAFDTVSQLVSQVPNNLSVYNLDKGSKVGEIKVDWLGRAVPVVTNRSISSVYWVDQAPTARLRLAKHVGESLNQQTILGQLEIGNDKVNLVAKENIPPASVEWRLINPLAY